MLVLLRLHDARHIAYGSECKGGSRAHTDEPAYHIVCTFA